jgi:hypothetical protein
MKKVVSSILIFCAVWAGSRTLEINSASAQITGLTGLPSLTDQFGFTNTLVQVTNVSNLQLNDVVALLLNLQTNVEQTLPALSLVISNAAVANANVSSNNLATPFQGFIAPITSNPAGLVSAPTTGIDATQSQSFSLVIGTNTFTIDPPTLQALVILRDNLERSLPVLQALNGTTPQPATNSVSSTPFFPNPPVTTFVPATITNIFSTPLTNQSPVLAPTMPAAL